MAFCSNCGNKLDYDAKFCSYCGIAIENSNIKSIVDSNISKKTGSIIIYRYFGIMDIFAPYKVLIDNREVCTIKIKEKISLNLKYGNHIIQFRNKYYFKGSKILGFQLNDEHPDVKVTCSCYDKLGTTVGILLAWTGPDDEYIKTFLEYL